MMKNNLFISLLYLLLIISSCSKKNDKIIQPIQPTTGITLLTPTRGPAGTPVTIDGQGFSTRPNDNIEVLFNGVKSKVVSASATQVVAFAPTGGSTGPVTVVSGKDTLTGGTFTYGAPLLVNKLTPSYGPPGAVIRVSGTGFGNTISQFLFYVNGYPAKLSGPLTDTAVSIIIPPNAGTGKVRAVVNHDSVTGPFFNYTTIIGLNPTMGLDGSVDTIIGSGFSPVLSENTVTFNGVPATVIGGDTTRLFVTVPNGIAGNVPVALFQNGLPVKLSAQQISNNVNIFRDTTTRITYVGFVYQPNPSSFAMDTVSVTSGPVGAFVRINGFGFNINQGSNQVFFNGTPAQTIIVGIDSLLFVKVPSGATSGPITVKSNGITATGPNYTVTTTGLSTFAGSFGNYLYWIYGLNIYTDGPPYAILWNPTTVALDSRSNVYTMDIDLFTNAINLDQLSPDGSSFTTIASTDAYTYYPTPSLLAIDAADNMFVSSSWAVFTIQGGAYVPFAGNPARGNTPVDGQGSAAQFGNIGSMTTDPSGNIWVYDTRPTGSFREITPSGAVTTPWSSAFFGVHTPSGGPAFDAAGNLYYPSNNSVREIMKITPAGNLQTLASWPIASTPNISQVFPDKSGNMYFNANNDVYQVVNGSPVKLTTQYQIPPYYWFDGPLNAMQISGSNMYLGPDGNIWIPDNQYGMIKKLVLH